MATWLAQFPEAFAEIGGMSLVKHQASVLVELKLDATLIQAQQYLKSWETKVGITPHIRCLMKLGILVPGRPTWNTLLLPVKKANSNDYYPI